jgi:hypothetical protein
VNVVLLVKDFDVRADDGVADFQLLGDLSIGLALQEELQDLLAPFGRGTIQGGMVFAFAFVGSVEVGGPGDLVAIKQTAGDVGDELVPTVVVDAAEKAKAVALMAGET